MDDIIVLVHGKDGAKRYYGYSSFDDFENEFEFLSHACHLDGAVLKGKLWQESDRFDDLHKKIKRMRWKEEK